MDKKPQVIPTKEQQSIATEEIKHKSYEAEKTEVVNEIYDNSVKQTQYSAVDEMRKRTEEQMKLRDEQLKKNLAFAAKYDKMTQDATNRPPTVVETKEEPAQVPYTSPAKQPVFQPEAIDTSVQDTVLRAHIERLSQPDFNSAYDLIPLPSEGKIYRGKRPNVRVSYMTTADENILTSPNLVQSGEFLEILINRKLLEPDLRYKDLHIGDRMAIMLWLRATGFGEMYPITLLDEKDVAFEASINLNSLKTKKLGAEPDAEGLFDFILPLSKSKIKFRLLNTGDLDEIEKLVESDKIKNDPINHTTTYQLERTLIDVDGNRDKTFVKNFANSLRLLDGVKLVEYINSIESGIDLNISVGTPGGGTVNTFFYFNPKFFWPNSKL